ncbi:MAG TPA: exodeoxyribonuclease III [Candidatus Nanopelagicales bacterium]|nr:exodeoxyribonuclease III [Candidatus Nanopelagicales bacterium]
MRIATWNINSVTVREQRLRDWLASAAPDVLCLQELKTATADFPLQVAADLGYEVAAHGTGRWNGVAVLSRVGLAEVVRDLPGQPRFDGAVEPRAIGATCGPVRVWSLYVPNGRSPDDPHYGYKLGWLDALRDCAAAELAGGAPLLLLGDFNIAPTDEDVWDRAALEGSTHVTVPERDRLADLTAAGLVEVVPRALKYDRNYTYWDYRQLAFPKNNGMRIDLVYAAPGVAGAVTDAYVDREARKPGKAPKGGPKPVPPSDHAPVVVDLDL